MGDQQQPQQQPQQQQQQQQPAWRDSNAVQPELCLPAQLTRHRILNRHANFSKKSMSIKARVLSDMLSRFESAAAKKKSRVDDCSEESIKDRFHFVRKPETKTQMFCKKNLQNAALLMKGDDSTILDLVTEIKSSKFKITADPKTDFNIARGVSTMSCFDKIPREPPVDLSDGNSLESRPDVTQKLENVSIHCDSYHINNSINHINDSINHNSPCMDLVDQAVSLNIGANTQNQTDSQLSFIDPESLVDFSRRFREYCTHTINPQLNESLEKFLAELSRLQRNLYNRDNVKGRFRRRYYAGFKEIERRLQLKKIKFVIIVPDLDKNKDNGELDKLVHRFIDSCRRYEIAVIFGLSRRKLGYLTHGKGFVSCIGVANYEALEDKLEDTLKKVLEAKNEFKILKGEPEKAIDIKKILTDDLLLSERVKVLLRTLVFT